MERLRGMYRRRSLLCMTAIALYEDLDALGLVNDQAERSGRATLIPRGGEIRERGSKLAKALLTISQAQDNNPRCLHTKDLYFTITRGNDNF